METIKILGSEIKFMRKKLQLTQQQLGEKLGVHYVTVCRWEKGLSTPHRFLMEKLIELAKSVDAYLPPNESL